MALHSSGIDKWADFAGRWPARNGFQADLALHCCSSIGDLPMSCAGFASKQAPSEHLLSRQLELGCSWMLSSRETDLVLCLSVCFFPFFFIPRATSRMGKDKVTLIQVASFTLYFECLADLYSLSSSTQGCGLTNENG